MRFKIIVWVAAALVIATVCVLQAGSDAPPLPQTSPRVFQARGTVVQIRSEDRTVVIKHEAIADYMEAMTMPFKVRDAGEMAHLHPGDDIRFRLLVSDSESWVDQIRRTGNSSAGGAPTVSSSEATVVAGPTNAPSFYLTDIPDFALTNELGKRVSLHQFQGQAVALTFFFTRCPIPDYCPRLSRNFAEVSQKLRRSSGGPTNWHLFSISFDPVDTPEVLRRYGEQYHYDPKHWSFITGDPAQIRSLTRGFGLSVTQESGLFLHDFRTAVFDANGRLQTMWPIGGDTSGMLLQELTKAAAAGRR